MKCDFAQPKIYLWKNSGLSSLANEDEDSYHHKVIEPTCEMVANFVFRHGDFDATY